MCHGMKTLANSSNSQCGGSRYLMPMQIRRLRDAVTEAKILIS